MKNLLILSSFIASVVSCFGQSHQGRIINYFDTNWRTSGDSSTASFFRTVEEKGDKFLVRNYYIAGSPEMEAECSAYQPKIIFDGKVTWYHDNGRISRECVYRNNEPEGADRSFYKNGQPKADRTHAGKTIHYNHYYRPDGQDYLVQGKAIIPDTTSESTRVNYLEIVDHEIIASFFIGKNDTVYYKVSGRMRNIREGGPG